MVWSLAVTDRMMHQPQNLSVLIAEPPVCFRALDGQLVGNGVEEIVRSLSDLIGIFADEAARAALRQSQIAYRVRSYSPQATGTSEALQFGVTFLEPGLVGNEYFMTKGHFHAKREATEYYWCLRGEGILLLMDEDRVCRGEWMRPGSLHYMPGHTAHRTVNTGRETLCFGACWPADAGHDYDSIARHGFSARVFQVNGQPQLVPVR
jgi:glucose-6-phosphate isomerase